MARRGIGRATKRVSLKGYLYVAIRIFSRKRSPRNPPFSRADNEATALATRVSILRNLVRRLTYRFGKARRELRAGNELLREAERALQDETT
jgi:hypothetical protein